MTKTEETDKLTSLYLHYTRGVQDMDTRRTRKNGWNDIVNAYMSKLPANWPFNSVTTDPRIRTSILEKTARLLNSKLQGRVIPREGGDAIKARIQNALLDFQWDYANEGGPMIEKIASADQSCRLFGGAFVQTYWDIKKNTNEIKNIDVRDIAFDGACNHIRNARWVWVREFTTITALEDRGYDMNKARKMIKDGTLTNQLRSSSFTDQVKVNRELEDRTGEYDNPKNPIIELITEWTPETATVWLPRYGIILKDEPNPYKHGLIPVSQLRYYPLGDDIFGESEVESVLPISRAINAFLCATIDETIMRIRPPLKIASTGVRIETIEYGPGARWIMQNPNDVVEMQFGQGPIANFNSIYPSLLAAYNTAMGDQSLGVSSGLGKASMQNPTATEVMATEKQQSNRDQYNQLYLSDFLKDMMMMWISNNRQFLFDDPTRKFQIIKIIGKGNIQALQQMELDGKDIPDEAMTEIQQMIESNPNSISDEMLNQVVNDVSIPTNPVVTNPNENPANFDIKQKLTINKTGESADLYLTQEDFEGKYDYIPDVKSMSAGASMLMQRAREKAMEFVLNPNVSAMLQTASERLKIKELVVAILEDAGYKDAESLFEKSQPIQSGQPGQGGQASQTYIGAGAGVAQSGEPPIGIGQQQGFPGLPEAVSNNTQLGGISQPQGF